MNSYLERNNELVDKETMITVGFIDHELQEIEFTPDYVTAYTTHTESVQEITHDYPTYLIAELNF